MRPRWLSGFRDEAHWSIMEMRTCDGVVYTLREDFVERSAVLKECPPGGPFDIPFRSKMVWYLQRGEFPTDGAELLELAKTADFLNMEEELDEACRRVADHLKGKTAPEVKKFLGIS